ncbi:MAG: aldolase [Ornithinimicrobium sp.]
MSTLTQPSSLADLARQLDSDLAASDAALLGGFPGDRGVRQPLHTVYVPGHHYHADLITEWGTRAGEALAENGGTAEGFAAATGLDADLMNDLYPRIQAKLEREPIEDLRIDFEDGFCDQGDEAEDDAAVAAARALTASLVAGTAAPFHGIRFKSFEAATRHRGLRTLDAFVGEMARGGAIGDGFLLTLPKVTAIEQVSAMATACDWLEGTYGLAAGRLGFEIQVETPQSIIGMDGTVAVSRMIQAAQGRCTGLHYGTYDYSASCGIAAEYQSMEHPAADFAKSFMQVSAAGTGVFVSDGSTNILPVGNANAVHGAWALHARLVRRSLERGFYQGWDLHPAQLPTRYAATFAFYRDGFDIAAARLLAYTGGGDSQYMDEPATATALAGFVLRGIECGAVSEDEATQLSGNDRSALCRLAKRRAVQPELA